MKNWNRTETWIALIVLAAGALVAAIVGLFAYMSVTATPLHPDAAGVPAMTSSAVPREWAGAVEQGRHIVRAGLVERNLPGLSVAVGVDGGIVWAEGFGWADLENQIPVAPNLRFRIGTASIALTSAAAGLLLEQDRFRLEDEIQTYVPAFPKKDWPVTLRELMGHTAGIRTDGGDEGPLFSQHCERPADALRFFADGSLRFEPGTAYRASSYGWILVSAAIEAAAGEPFFAFMQEQVFEPLGMHETMADSVSEPIPDRVTPYFPRFGADPRYGLHVMREIDLSCYAGAGAFLSTPSDLVRFGMAMNDGRLLKRATTGLLQTSQRLPSGEETGYGLGWDLETAAIGGEQTRLAGHDGAVLGGTVASLVTLPERNLAVAIASNISYADTFSLAVQIAEAFATQRGDPARE